MAMARGFETLMLKSEAKAKFMEAKVKLESQLEATLTHSNAMELICKTFLSDTPPENTGKKARETRSNIENLAPIQISRNLLAARNLTASIFGSEYMLIPLLVKEAELIDLIGDVLASIDPLESKILEMNFGFGFPDFFSMDELATAMGMSKRKILNIKIKALRKLRHPSRAEKIKDMFAPFVLEGS